jgi:hypothetical protein
MNRLFRSLFFSSVVGLGRFIGACSAEPSLSGANTERLPKEPTAMTLYDPDQAVSSEDSPAAGSSDFITPQENVMIEGKISAVLESYPLQLMVETNTGRYHVALLMDTIVQRNEQPIDQNQLQAEMRVQIEGIVSSVDDRAMTAQTIRVL